MNFVEVVAQNDVKAIGVVHVGAHNAEEADQYVGLNQLYIEPIPQLAQQMRAKGLDVAEVAASDRQGKKLFFVTEFTQGSSLLKPKEHEIRETIEVKTDLLRNIITTPEDYNCMVVDTQGSELQVLKGAELSDFELIVCETNVRQRYENAATHDEIVEYLADNDFILVEEIAHSADGIIKDCVFRRGSNG